MKGLGSGGKAEEEAFGLAENCKSILAGAEVEKGQRGGGRGEDDAPFSLTLLDESVKELPRLIVRILGEMPRMGKIRVWGTRTKGLRNQKVEKGGGRLVSTPAKGKSLKCPEIYTGVWFPLGGQKI